MKKQILTAIAVISLATSVKSQVVISEDFSTYNGFANSITSGLYISWNDTASASRSYYLNAPNCGVTCPAYKFGIDSATIITPYFAPGANVVEFYMKGNGTQHVENTFEVSTSPDSINWTVFQSIDTISPAVVNQSWQLPLTAAYLKFVFYKPVAGYNCGFDDLKILTGTVGLNTINGSKVLNVYPNPARTVANVYLPEQCRGNLNVTISNILGNTIRTFNTLRTEDVMPVTVSDLTDGVYLLKVKSETTELVTRLVVKK